jgi:hypothetical protein
VCDLLDELAKRLDETPAAQDYFSQRRRVMHRVLGHAVWKRLSRNPLSQGNLLEGWSRPPRPDDAIALGRLAAPSRATVRQAATAPAIVWPAASEVDRVRGHRAPRTG